MTTLDDVESFMFAYRELHLPGKLQIFSSLHRLYEEISQKDLWLERQEQRERKDQILNSLAMATISSAMMILEDFFYTCYSLSQDTLKVPETLAEYRRSREIVSYLEANVNRQFCVRILHYVWHDDLNRHEYEFLTTEDKTIIVKQHGQNARALDHTLRIALRVYRMFSDAYNKYKHGFLFLFRSLGGESGTPELVQKLGPMIPYFADPTDPVRVTSIFVGAAVLDKLRTLFAGSGGVFQILWDLTMNLTALCKYDGHNMIARQYYGPQILSPDEVIRFKQLIEIFDNKFIVSPGPKKLALDIRSQIDSKEWEWFLGDWEFAQSQS